MEHPVTAVNENITEILESIEHEAVGDFYHAVPDDLKRGLGVFAENIGGVDCLAVRARPQSIMWNHAQGFGESAAATEELLGRIVDFYGRHQTRGAICMTPRASTEQAVAMLQAHGYEPGYAYRKFIRRKEPLPDAPSDLIVRPARAADAKAFGEIVAMAFGTPERFAGWIAALVGRPKWHCFLAWDGDRPAGTGALFISGGIGYCTFGATHPDFRRRGAQRVLLAHRIAEGISLGCTTFVTETGEAADGKPEQSYRNILWAGFEPAYLRDNWVKLA